jgi:23S rRNA (cytosine1962-C5)-methyltransferase
VVLKPGKEKAIKQRHHWIYSGAIQSLPSFQDGEVLEVYDFNSKKLGSGYFNKQSSIIGRMLVFDDTPAIEYLNDRLVSAISLRQALINPQLTNAYRLVNGEGDGLPGLIIDQYDRTLVLQISTKGMDRLKPWIIQWLTEKIKPKTIFEKSNLPTRKEEGLEEFQGVLAGEEPTEIQFKENGLQFTTILQKSQKTGFFLDHREMRQWIREISHQKTVLNAFSYTGGFSVYALAGGAKKVDSVDISSEAIEQAKKQLSLNGFNLNQNEFYCEDLFNFLRERELPYDLVILDPPAFAKKQKDVIAACRGYKDINRLAIKKMAKKSLLLTCSCSYHVDESLFQKVLFQAALEAGRQVRMIGRHRLAPDHPINLYHPESNYLKSFLLYIE